MTKKNKKGFTLIELILYIALIAIFIGGAIKFAWNIVYGSVRSKVQRSLNEELRFASKRIIYEIRNSSGLNNLSVSDLCLSSNNSARNPTRVYLSSGLIRIAWGGGSSNCTGMTNDQALTSNKTTVNNLIFQNYSSGTETINIKFSLTISSTGVRKEWQKTQSYSSSVELRSK